MTKEEFEELDYKKEPVFDKNFVTSNMMCITSQSDKGTLTNLYRINEQGLPCYCQYFNGKLQLCNTFSDIESLKGWFKREADLLSIFCEWMEEYDKHKAKIIDLKRN